MRMFLGLSVLAALCAAPSRAEPTPPAEAEITITLAGDTGLNASRELVYAGFAAKQGKRLAWRDATSSIASELTGDINFANLETVVTDRNDLEPKLKLFTFRTHPEGVRHLASIGLNLLSTANNHAMDFGLEGARETLKHLQLLGVAHAGLGATRAEARAPRFLDVKGRRFALEALGVIGAAYTSPAEDERRPGQLAYADPDFGEAVAALAASPADFKILSVHYGQEFEVKTNTADRRRLTQAIAQGANLVVGHHQHVVAGVEIIDGKPIFYGLGNFLHWGTQDMSRFDICRDYGLIARVHLSAKPNEAPKLRAIEAIPITQMHATPRRMESEDARTRIAVLNHLADQFGPRGVRFATEAGGAGLHCAPGAEALATPLGARCRGAKLTSLSAERAAKIEDACAKRVVRIVENEDGLEPEFAPADFDGSPLRPWP